MCSLYIYTFQYLKENFTVRCIIFSLRTDIGKQTIAFSSLLMHQSIPPTPSPSPPGQLWGICPPCQSRGWGICECCTAQGPGICQSRAFVTHAVSYQNITTKKVLVEEKQIGSFVKDRNKLQRVVTACSRFYVYVCISSLLTKPELRSEIGAIDVNQRLLVTDSNFC